jgi:riboflavin kinase
MSNVPHVEGVIELTGTVADGKGEGKFFVGLDGYAEQFESKLGYTPFPGTLNLHLSPDSTERREALDTLEPIHIDGWEDGDRTYGPVTCYVVCFPENDTVEAAHVLVPERTDHGEDRLEIIAPVKLRDACDLDDGDRFTVTIGDQQ